MNDTNQRLSADDIEALLPWYAAGTLDARQAGEVEAALAADAKLRRRLDLVREEMTEAIILNEALGVPSARVAEKLFSAIDEERRAARAPAGGGRLAGWFADLFSPRVLAFAAGAAVLLIAVEAGVIARLAMRQPPVTVQDQGQPQAGTYTTASTRAVEVGVFAKVRFVPQASVAEVTRLLDMQKALIVDGPSEGTYRVRIGQDYVPQEEHDRVIREFRSASNIVASATPD
jgi:anti-sigma factor RsiW